MSSSINTTTELPANIVDHWKWIAGTNVSEYNFTNNSSLDLNYYSYYYRFDYAAFFDEFRFKLVDFLVGRLSIVFFIVCLLCNFLTILVLSRKGSRQFSTSIFLVSLAVSDMVVSMFYLDAFLTSNGFALVTYNDFDCKFRLFLSRAGSTSSKLTLAVVSIERAVSVKLPHKIKLIFTVKVARLLVVLIWIFSIAFACLQSFLRVYTTYPGYPVCLSPSATYIAHQIKVFLNIILSIGSLAVSGFCTFIIVNALLKNAIVKDVSSKTKIKSVTKSLLIVNIVYILFVGPATIYDTYLLVIKSFLNVHWYLRDLYNNINTQHILFFLKLTNNVLNFFIYFLSGSRFRRETKNVFLSLCGK